MMAVYDPVRTVLYACVYAIIEGLSIQKWQETLNLSPFWNRHGRALFPMWNLNAVLDEFFYESCWPDIKNISIGSIGARVSFLNVAILFILHPASTVVFHTGL